APAMPARAAAMAPAPMSPMAPGSRAIGAASGYAPPAPPPPPPHELDLLDAESDDMAIDAMAAPADLVSYSREEAQKESASPLDRTLEAQRASGLWDASHTTLAASIAALRVLVREGITTSHAIYGANAKKAVEAVVSLAGSTAIPASERETALLLAYLVASGRKSRALVLDAIRASAPALEARLADEAALRKSLLA
ncbi:MAG: hypothetical protein K1X94_34045, partial [Sandaracinaceae bacterium]|nr:hypothetical protein [Sandaracinaceae bacterium]